MRSRWLWIVIGANLVVLVALAFVYPHLMLAPGALEPGHAALTTDCLACHTPGRGATADRCIACHALPDIGRRTTLGAAIVHARPVKVAFHQELSEQNCMACHSDHAGPKLTKQSRKPYLHDLLRVATRERCESCHQAPTDALHQQMTGNCAACHKPHAWQPATFDHARFFPLDRNHNATCVTCHSGNIVQRYTCYGCHEHTPANMQAQHREEVGSENIDHCVRCHRNASGEGEGKGHGERGRGQREKD